MPTSIRPCKCAHVDQDKRFGAGNRLHNETGKKRQGQGVYWRCTVCRTEKGK